MKRLRPFWPLIALIVLIALHKGLWHHLSSQDAAASLFSSGPQQSVLLFVEVFAFMTIRIFLYLITPGWIVAFVVGRIIDRCHNRIADHSTSARISTTD